LRQFAANCKSSYLETRNVRSILRTISDVITSHVTEAPFLVGIRDSATLSPHYYLLDLTRLDHRLEAHIDGLRVAGEEGWQLARKELAWKEPGEVFTAAILAFESASPTKIAEVISIAAPTPNLACGAISALGWMDYHQAAPRIQKLCTSELRSHRRIGIAAAAIHRQDPGKPLNDALSSGDPLLRERAARAVGELGRTDLVSLLQLDLNAKDPGYRFWAAWSSALLAGYSSTIQLLQTIASSPGPYRERALNMALRRLGLHSARAWHQQLARDPQTLRLAVIGAGIIGDPALIPWLIDHMSIPPLARVAGEAFTMITGVDLAYEDLDCKQPEDFEAGPSEDPADDNVEMDPDERLPWPDVALIERWWAKRHGEFAPGARYLLGKPITIEGAEQVLRMGKQRQRAAAAMELAILRPGSVLFEVRAPGFRQQQVLQYRSYR
jgi:uncharacterized protein (TIGR02270 family)